MGRHWVRRTCCSTSRKAIDFLWIACAVAGLVLLLPLGEAATHLDPVGIGYALTAGVGWALYIVFGQMAGNAHGGQATSLGMTMAALVALPFGVAHAGAEMFSPGLLLSGCRARFRTRWRWWR
jgi:inner membrane transporter RhtA